MKEFRASVTSRGQVTIPADVRRHLGVGTPDKVAFVLDEDGTVRLSKPITHTVLSLAGSIPALKRPTSVDFDAEIADAMDEATEHIFAKMRQ
jgi:AbrB family looped-hinge helix DNA binding protein